jgi:hypothetical protein
LKSEKEESGWAGKRGDLTSPEARTYGFEDIQKLLKTGSTASRLPFGRHLTAAQAAKLDRGARRSADDDAAKLEAWATQVKLPAWTAPVITEITDPIEVMAIRAKFATQHIPQRAMV